MSQWYYTDRERRQYGPVDAGEFVRLYRAGLLDGSTLVWREGLPQWQPLAGLLGELGLREAPSPYSPPSANVDVELRPVAGGAVVYAGFWKRVAAYCIDATLSGLVSAVIGGVIGGVMGALLMGGGNVDSGAMMAIQLFGNVVGLVIGLAYFAGFHASSSMATLGKMAVGIKVVRSDGERIGFLRGMGRYFALFVSSITLGIGFIMAGFTDRKRSLHDMMCDTVVVDKWAFTAHPEWQRPDLGAVTIVVLALYGLMILVGIGVIAVAVGLAAANAH